MPDAPASRMPGDGPGAAKLFVWRPQTIGRMISPEAPSRYRIPDMASNDPREFDIVIYGSTGFTGRLVVEYLVKRYGVGGDLRWAVAGRNPAKLELVKEELGAPASLPIIVADASDARSVEAMAARTRAVLTTVGPYQLYGEPLVAACAAAGTDYVDLCGEPGWMAEMIAKYQDKAKVSGARIVFSCGFDSIPFDLGVWFLQDQARQRFGAPLPCVHGRVRNMKGGFSGGTIASLLATLEASQRDPSLPTKLANPFLLTPGFAGPAQPPDDKPLPDKATGVWAASFIMATINTKNVHRTNFLLNHAYGADFTYDEMMLTGPGEEGAKRARKLDQASRTQSAMLGFAPTRALLRRFALPKPGQGPSKVERETGSYDVLFVGEGADGRTLRAGVKGDRDPGYGSTSKMIAESAICIARDVSRAETPGGVWTPGSAMAGKLIERLRQNAGLTFSLEN